MRASFSTQNLLSWYQKSARDLPWRKISDPYKIWISEVMLQQTTVATVIPYYERWIKVFPTLESVAQAPIEKILKLWQGLGYYQRAKNVKKTAKIIGNEYGGKFPRDPQALKKLPGFGPYTTGAVLSIAFNQPSTIIDANVRRVIMRQLALKGFADTSQDKRIKNFLEKRMPAQNSGTFNQALMELGAVICRPKEPVCILCPIKESCAGYRKGIQELIPEIKPRVINDIEAVIALLKKDDKYFIQKRAPKGLLADLWEFPGGKVEKGESLIDALNREMREELNVAVRKAEFVMTLQHFYTQYRVHLTAFRCELDSYPSSDSTHRWVSVAQLFQYPMPSGSAKIVDKLLSRAQGSKSEQQLVFV